MQRRWPIERFDLIRWLGVILVLATGAVHMSEIPGGFDHHWTLGMAFTLNATCASLAALGIGCDVRNMGWRLGFLICGGSLALFLISQTVGLPGVAVRSWTDPAVLYAAAVETIFLFLMLLVVRMPAWQRQTAEVYVTVRNEE